MMSPVKLLRIVENTNDKQLKRNYNTGTEERYENHREKMAMYP